MCTRAIVSIGKLEFLRTHNPSSQMFLFVIPSVWVREPAHDWHTVCQSIGDAPPHPPQTCSIKGPKEKKKKNIENSPTRWLFVPFLETVTKTEIQIPIPECLRATLLMFSWITSVLISCLVKPMACGLAACLEMGSKGNDGSNHQELRKIIRAEMFASVIGLSVNKPLRQSPYPSPVVPIANPGTNVKPSLYSV